MGGRRYAPALARRDQLSESERRDLTAELARFTGFGAALIDQKDADHSDGAVQRATAARSQTRGRPLRQPADRAVRSRASEDVRPDQGPEPAGHHRRRRGGAIPAGRAQGTRATSLSGTVRRRISAADVVPRRLDVGAMEPIAGEHAAGPGRSGRSAAAARDDANPQLRVMSSCGYYDLVCSYSANAQAAAGWTGAGRARRRAQLRRRTCDLHRRQGADELKREWRAFLQDVQSGTAARSARHAAISARAGMLPIRVNETGDVHGQVFYHVLRARRAAGRPRPLMFLWNGGPGSNSVLLHLAGFGPQGSSLCECEHRGQRRDVAAEADLVFVDPIGTGFSRPTAPSTAPSSTARSGTPRRSPSSSACISRGSTRGPAAVSRGRKLRLVAGRRRRRSARTARHPRRGRAADLRRGADRPRHRR